MLLNKEIKPLTYAHVDISFSWWDIANRIYEFVNNFQKFEI